MNKILKKITSSALAVVISLSAAANVFASGNIGYSTVSGKKPYDVTNSQGLTFSVVYQASGQVTVGTFTDHFTFNASTSIKANEPSEGCWIPPENFIIDVGWEVVNYYTGVTCSGYKGEKASKVQTTVQSGTLSVPRDSSRKDITVFGSHTAYKDGTAIMQKYTTTFSPDL